MLAKILFDDRAAHQYEPRKPEETEMIAQTFIPITRSIPLEHLYGSYVSALEARAPGNSFQITAVELLQGWKTLQGAVEMESVSGVKLLAEHASASCQRCFGKGQDITPDGARPCDHVPLSDDEIAERARHKADGIRWMKEEAERQRAARRVEETKKPDVAKPVYVDVACSECGHKGNTVQGWRVNDACTIPNCTGRMEQVV